MKIGAFRRPFWGDIGTALLLAVLLAVGWTLRDWHQLAALRLPDTDDMMRLQQIRDWLAGQRFSDLSQHRLGEAPGLAMHWSRVADLVPAALIAALSPLAGSYSATLVTVILWPTALFAASLALIGRIARLLAGPGAARVAIVVAALAYPATTVFLPGRIDHHNLQILLVLVAVRALLAVPTIGAGLVAGVAATVSLVIGLEAAPMLCAAFAAISLAWLQARPGAEDRLMGFGIGISAGMLAASIVFRTDQWLYPACDGFTATAWRGAVTLGFAPMTMALAARDLTGPIKRAVLGTIICTVIGAGTLSVAPGCLSPYGGVDPLLAKLWLSQVAEAQSLFAAPAATGFGYAGVMVAGIAGTIWRRVVTRDTRWTILLIVQLAALVTTCLQLRGAYAGAMLAAPALAALIAAARRRGSGWLAGAWLASAGMLYPIAATAVTPAPAASETAGRTGGCTSPEVLARLAALPPGRLLAPLDLGAYAIGATRLSVVGAPYHRNNAGNLAVYHVFLGQPAQAAEIARHWDVRYVALCADGFGNGPGAPGLAMQLRAGQIPAWLRPLGGAAGMTLYQVQPASQITASEPR